MTNNLAKFPRMLAGGAVLALLCTPALALDVGASVGGISAGASIGGNGARAGASIGGTTANASIGGGSGVNASIGGAPAGTSANVSIGGGNGANANVDVGPASASIGIGTSSAPNAPGAPSSPGISGPALNGVVAEMSDRELQQNRKRCVQVLADAGSYDRDLVSLCRLVQTASR